VAGYPRMWLVCRRAGNAFISLIRGPHIELHHVPNAKDFNKPGFGDQRDIFVDIPPHRPAAPSPPPFYSHKFRLMITTLDLAAASSDPVARRMLASLSLSVAKSKRIVVVTGAGISCSCGIPVRRRFTLLHSINVRLLIRTRRTSVLRMGSMRS
jgi:hypothetical protein